MKIGFDGSRAFFNNKTGTENYSFQLLKHLAKIDSKNQYIIYLRPLASQGPALQGWPTNFHFTMIPYSRLWTQFGLAQQTFKDKIDVLFVPAHTLPLIRKPGLKTVVTVHDLGAEYLPQTHQLKQRVYLKLITDFQLKSAGYLIAVSRNTKDDLVKKVHINPNKITVIYEGYDKTAFKPLKTDELKDTLNYYDLERDRYFLFVGTIQPRKNLERLIKAFANFLAGGASRGAPYFYYGAGEQQDPLKPRTKKIQLILTGSKGWLSEEIYELPKKLGIENQVKFLGYVPDKNLPALYSGATALLFPSLFEGFGLPLLEAMACGTPVLTSNLSSMPEISGKAALLVDPYSEEQIAQGINRLFYDQKLKNQLKKLGIAQAQKYSWERCAEETLKLLEATSD